MNKITAESLRLTAAAMDAHGQGKPVQWRHHKHVTGGNHEWKDHGIPVTFTVLEEVEYRPKPEPKRRPWRSPEDVPGPVVWLRVKSTGWECMVIMVNHGRVTLIQGRANTLESVTFEDLQNYEYSTDRKTWHPCTVEESEA